MPGLAIQTGIATRSHYAFLAQFLLQKTHSITVLQPHTQQIANIHELAASRIGIVS